MKKREKKCELTFSRIFGSKYPCFGEYLVGFLVSNLLESKAITTCRVEHTGVKARQRAGTLETVLKYDAKALSVAWDYLASSVNDD